MAVIFGILLTLIATIGALISLWSLRHSSKVIKPLQSQIEPLQSQIKNVEERLDILDQRERRPAQPYRDPATGKETQVICIDCHYCGKGEAALICQVHPVAPKPEYKAPHFKLCAIVNKNRDCPDFKPKAEPK